MMKLFGARKLTWNGLVCEKDGRISPRQDCVLERKSIGEGAWGKVYRGKYCIHYEVHDVTLDVAVKQTSRGTNNSELENLVELKEEEEIIHLYNYCETMRKKMFVVELCKGGDLLDLVRARPLSVPQALGVLHWLVRAVDKCHQHGIIHTDIKLENIGVKQENSLTTLKLLDFGNSKRIVDAPFSSRELRGSPHYIAPELKLKRTFSDPDELRAIDMWSVGIVAYGLLEYQFYPGGEIKFSHCNSDMARTLVRNLLTKSARRWTTQQCIDHFTAQ